MNKCYTAADILLPDFHTVDPAKWAVVACDQFTSEPNYWQQVDQLVGNAPSTLRMILPEVYLSEAENRIPAANAAMQEYLQTVLHPHANRMMYVERTQSDGSIRRGIVLAIDLACYDYQKGASSLIRATEATVVERIPPRVAIRRNAVIESPHIMLLIDDRQKSVIEPLRINEEKQPAVYHTELMLGGGRLYGRFLTEQEIRHVNRTLDALITPDAMEARYGDRHLAPLLFAVGDGNHSLASAKAAYEEIKEKLGTEIALRHPARYALAEVVNIHDPALKFEPIYRVLFHVSPQRVLRELAHYISTLCGTSAPQEIEYIHGEEYGTLSVPAPIRQLTVGTLQDFIDRYVATDPHARVDYIHGTESVRSLCRKENTLGFLFSGMEKDQLFSTVMFDGALPRKTFSMGQAEDKRYYMECRKIIP